MLKSPFGVPYPGRWVRWGGEWYEAHAPNRAKKTIALSIESRQAPAWSWENCVDIAEGWRRFSRSIPVAEVEAYETVTVGAVWRGYDIGLGRIAPYGRAWGWAEPPTNEDVEALLSQLKAAGHEGNVVEYRVMQVVLDANELTDFRVASHTENLAALRQGMGLSP